MADIKSKPEQSSEESQKKQNESAEDIKDDSASCDQTGKIDETLAVTMAVPHEDESEANSLLQSVPQPEVNESEDSKKKVNAD